MCMHVNAHHPQASVQLASVFSHSLVPKTAILQRKQNLFVPGHPKLFRAQNQEPTDASFIDLTTNACLRPRKNTIHKGLHSFKLTQAQPHRHQTTAHPQPSRPQGASNTHSQPRCATRLGRNTKNNLQKCFVRAMECITRTSKE